MNRTIIHIYLISVNGFISVKFKLKSQLKISSEAVCLKLI